MLLLLREKKLYEKNVLPFVLAKPIRWRRIQVRSLREKFLFTIQIFIFLFHVLKWFAQNHLFPSFIVILALIVVSLEEEPSTWIGCYWLMWHYLCIEFSPFLSTYGMNCNSQWIFNLHGATMGKKILADRCSVNYSPFQGYFLSGANFINGCSLFYPNKLIIFESLVRFWWFSYWDRFDRVHHNLWSYLRVVSYAIILCNLTTKNNEHPVWFFFHVQSVDFNLNIDCLEIENIT